MKSIVKKISKIESIAYKDCNYMCSLKYARSIRDIKDYMGTDLVEIYHNDYSYIICGIEDDKLEIGDLATTQSLSMSDFGNMISFLSNVIKKYNIRFVTCDMREKTSYRLLKYIEKRLNLKVVSDSDYYWNDEKMFAIVLKVK
jgi:hypothetical protein